MKLFSRKSSSDDLQDRLAEYASDSTLTLDDVELSQPFSERVIIPLIKWVAESVTRITPEQAIEKSRVELEQAGRPIKSPEMLFGIKGTLAIVIMGLVIFSMVASNQRFIIILLAAPLSAGLGFMLPTLWLGSKKRARQTEIEKSLPDVLDLLVICVEAGLGFETAMLKVAEKWDNQLAKGFARVLQEIRLGKLRTDALREMDNNMGVADVKSFVAAIIQATTFGVSIANVLRIQSENMRDKRRQRAEQAAAQAPIKMIFPMVFITFPAIFIVLLGPAYLQVADSVLGG
ncbi:MAG: hypothetical protein B6242_02045 [Anaerolineaceae bacterium 4572_78]|nr:MAG: hypothetical protein B6242_02045 [Anaerolineaceae bacterium 4572_78]